MTSWRLQEFLPAVAVLTLIWSAHVCLDFHYGEASHYIASPQSPYTFFWMQVLALFVLLTTNRGGERFYSSLPNRHFWILIFGGLLLAIAIIVSLNSTHTMRLPSIVIVLSLISALAGFVAFYTQNISKPSLVLIVSSPSILVVLGAFVWFGLNGFGTNIHDITGVPLRHGSDDLFRWMFLNSSANGFGFDAGLALIGSISLLLFQKLQSRNFVLDH